MKRKMPVKPILHPITKQEIYEIWGNIHGGILRTAFAVLYLYGLRVTEMLMITKKDFEIKVTSNGDKILMLRANTLKNKKYKIRNLPVFMKGIEGEMAEEIINYASVFSEGERLFPMSRFSVYHRLARHTPSITVKATIPGKTKVITITRKIHPHYLRHCRLTHLVEEYGYDAHRLMYFAGWTDPKVAEAYVRLDWQALAKAMMNQNYNLK